MIDKLLKYIKSTYKAYIIVLIFLLLNTISFDYEIYSPGGLIELNDRIIVDNEYSYDGSFNLTYVSSKRATIINLLLASFIKSWDIVPLDDSRIENESSKDINNRGKIYLKETSYDALISAFNEANIEYTIHNIDVVVTHVFNSSKTNLEVGDIIKSVNDIDILDYNSLKDEIKKYNENDKLDIKVLRDDKYIDCYSQLVKEEDSVIIGISLAELKNIKSIPSVKYVFKDNERGSSRGLLCALDIYNKITKYDLTKGKIISGTGSIDEYGNVLKISGVKYKLSGAVKNGADVFIVPSENYDEAISLKKKYDYDIQIIQADTLHNVINKLKEL